MLKFKLINQTHEQNFRSKTNEKIAIKIEILKIKPMNIKMKIIAKFCGKPPNDLNYAIKMIHKHIFDVAATNRMDWI